jgi:hypothetical protein
LRRERHPGSAAAGSASDGVKRLENRCCQYVRPQMPLPRADLQVIRLLSCTGSHDTQYGFVSSTQALAMHCSVSLATALEHMRPSRHECAIPHVPRLPRGTINMRRCIQN